MPSRRRAILSAAIVTLVAISLVEIGMGGDHWPFSSYRMYSLPGPRRVVHLQFMGIPADRPDVRIRIAPVALDPLGNARLREAVQTRLREGAPIDPFLTKVLERHETLRLEGVHHQPELAAIELYRVRTRIVPGDEWRNAGVLISRVDRHAP